MRETYPTVYGDVMQRLLAALLALLFSLWPCAALACPAYPGVQEITDAAGNTLRLRAYGDEFFSYLADTDGNLLHRGGDGLYYTIVAEGDAFVPGTQARGGVNAQADARNVNVRDAGADFREKLEAFYAAQSRAGASLSGGTSALDGYVPVNGVDPLYGKWVAEGKGFTQPAMPARGARCPLLVLKIEYADVKCLFTDEQWHARIFGDAGVSGYYNEASDNRFTYAPAIESSGAINDGVITVTLPISMPRYVQRCAGHNYDNGASADVYTATDGVHRYAIYGNASLFTYGLEAAAAHIDFSQYDQKNDAYYNGNSDGYISPTELAILVVNAGYEASYGLSGTGDPTTWASSWFANNWWKPDENDDDNIRGEEGGVLLDGVMLYKYTILGENLSGPPGNGSSREYDYAKTPEWNRAQGNIPHPGTVGTACHELGHDLGLRDLYDTSASSFNVREVLGLSLMAGGSWGMSAETLFNGGDPGSAPSHLDAYSKLRLGFYTARTVSLPGAYALTRASDSAHYNILRVDTDDPDVYYLLENRTFTGFDAGMFLYFDPPGGVVLWRVDESVIREKYENNTLNNTPGRYGLMPEYVHYEYDRMTGDSILCKPFRNNATYADYPAQRVFTLPEKGDVSLFCFDEAAPTMNVWLRLYAPEANDGSAAVTDNATPRQTPAPAVAAPAPPNTGGGPGLWAGALLALGVCALAASRAAKARQTACGRRYTSGVRSGGKFDLGYTTSHETL